MIDLKKGDKVILKGFTGIKLGVFEIDSATKKTVTILKKNGDEMIFDRKTGTQVNVEEGKERYANSIIEDDGSFVAPSTQSASKRKAAKAKAQTEPDEDKDEEESKSAKKSKKAAPAKKSKKKPEPEDDDDDFEEDED